MHPKLLPGRLETSRKYGSPIFVGPLMSLERCDFGEVKIPCIETPVFSRSPRKSLGDIGNTVQVNIMYDNQPVVARRNNVLFEVVSAHGIGQRLGRNCVLRQVPGGATMRNHDWPHSMGPFSSKPGKSSTSQRAVSSPRACRLR